MGRNLYILAGTLGALALMCLGLSLTGIAAAPGDASIWRFIGFSMLLLSLLIGLAGVLSMLFEQAERRAEGERTRDRRRRRAS